MIGAISRIYHATSGCAWLSYAEEVLETIAKVNMYGVPEHGVVRIPVRRKVLAPGYKISMTSNSSSKSFLRSV
jgi:hypothetical protein